MTINYNTFHRQSRGRDATELQKPTATNAAVIRFYRYVQAARDGQDQRDCRQVYSLCTINIDKKKK
ncbi:conserved hypothetical protein [Culex quinquefasciatus]|uniref:Uncharacterized protein n=1 Tax=Culex quinquefasciatus TaxID=7176 RepID=B0WS69_CULQU|nr:conserved hypothetical protein [Culex quinquefasciatus]|eukprot:XP_001851553.1 conserved hypothetical protein [Culex quinquefasciatus]